MRTFKIVIGEEEIFKAIARIALNEDERLPDVEIGVSVGYAGNEIAATVEMPYDCKAAKRWRGEEGG